MDDDDDADADDVMMVKLVVGGVNGLGMLRPRGPTKEDEKRKAKASTVSPSEQGVTSAFGHENQATAVKSFFRV